jgi:hypothetical protein
MLLQTVLAFTMLGQVMRYPRPVFPPVPPYVPATEQFEDYPVQVRILDTHWSRGGGGYIGYGRADILGPTPNGADYSYSCDEPFKSNDLHGEFYGAKWKKPETKLEIILQQVGSNHTTLCTLKVTLKPVPYSPASATWLDPAPAPAPATAAPILHRPPQ